MATQLALIRKIWIGTTSLIFSTLCMPPVALSQEGGPMNVRISPLFMAAILPEIEVNDTTIERWASVTELNRQQIEAVGLRSGTVVDLRSELIRNLGDDEQSRNFTNFFDRTFGRPNDQITPLAWKSANFNEFIADAAAVGGFDSRWSMELKRALTDASVEGDEPAQIKARGNALRMLSEARLAATKRIRGYRALSEILFRELEGRGIGATISFAVEVRTQSLQPTISPISIVKMNCAALTPEPILNFTQKKRECNEFGACRVESLAKVASRTELVFRELRANGRTFLDKCELVTTMLLDSKEVTQVLPGKFTSNTPTPSVLTK